MYKCTINEHTCHISFLHFLNIEGKYWGKKKKRKRKPKFKTLFQLTLRAAALISTDQDTSLSASIMGEVISLKINFYVMGNKNMVLF